MSRWDPVIDDAIEELNTLKRALNGKVVGLEDDRCCFGAMDVYELIDAVKEQLGRVSHDVMNTHIEALENQLKAKLEG